MSCSKNKSNSTGEEIPHTHTHTHTHTHMYIHHVICLLPCPELHFSRSDNLLQLSELQPYLRTAYPPYMYYLHCVKLYIIGRVMTWYVTWYMTWYVTGYVTGYVTAVHHSLPFLPPPRFPLTCTQHACTAATSRSREVKSKGCCPGGPHLLLSGLLGPLPAPGDGSRSMKRALPGGPTHRGMGGWGCDHLATRRVVLLDKRCLSKDALQAPPMPMPMPMPMPSPPFVCKRVTSGRR